MPLVGAEPPDACLPKTFVDADAGDVVEPPLLVKQQLMGRDPHVGRRFVLSRELALPAAWSEEAASGILTLATALGDGQPILSRKFDLQQVQAHRLAVDLVFTPVIDPGGEAALAPEIGNVFAQLVRRHEVAKGRPVGLGLHSRGAAL